ncbi:ArsR family transcriptional regulator [bacterium]|nr:MAG: ArsR family transcriptional regulator [bacterium]
MNQKIREVFEKRSEVFKALAHPTRLFIVDQLSFEEKAVSELTGMIGVDTSTVSKHLSILKNARIVADEKRGSMVYYSLKMRCVLGFFDCIQTALHAEAKDQLEAAGQGQLSG